MNEAVAPQFSGLEFGLVGIGSLLLLVALILGIVVAVKMCQNNQVALGIISMILMLCTGIGHLIALVFGWMKATEWNIKGLMTAYTVCLLLGFALFFGGYGMMLPKIIKAAEQQQQQMLEEMEAQEEQNWDVEEPGVNNEEPAAVP